MKGVVKTPVTLLVTTRMVSYDFHMFIYLIPRQPGPPPEVRYLDPKNIPSKRRYSPACLGYRGFQMNIMNRFVPSGNIVLRKLYLEDHARLVIIAQ